MRPRSEPAYGEREVDGITVDFDARYRMTGAHAGVAWHLWGPETEPDEDTEWTGIENETGRVLACMVGDDRWEAVDPRDLEPIADEDYCSGCGQIGCPW